MNPATPTHQLEGVAEGWCLCSLPDGRLAFEGRDHSLCLWTPESSRIETLLKQKGKLFFESAASLDANRLACIGFEDELIVLDIHALQEIRRASYVWNCSPYYRPDKISAGEGWFALGFYRGHIAVFDSNSCELLAELPEEDSQVWTLQALPGKRLLFGRARGDLGVWSWETGHVSKLRESGSYGESWGLNVSGVPPVVPEGFEQFKTEVDETVVSCQTRGSEDIHLAVEPHWLVTGRESGAVEFFDMASGEVALAGEGGWLIRCLCEMPGGRVVSLSETGVVSVWRLPTD